MWRRGKLSTRILASIVAILMATTVIGFGLNAASRRNELEHEYQDRALAIAQTFAATPSIREGLYRRDAADRAVIQGLAQEVRRETGASYIVVIDAHGIRFSHPDPALIGRRVTEPVVALDGRDHVGVDHGNLGVSANARVPLRAPDGRVIGEVSAGIPEAQVSSQLVQELPQLLLYFLSALAIGLVASVLLTRKLKRSTFGLELEEIAALVQEREAMLHNIREGVITVDGSDRVTLINDEARRLLSLGDTVVGEPIRDLVAPGRLRSLLTGSIAGQDQVVLTDEHVLVVSRVPVSRDGRNLGAVITLRDRTELEALMRELDGVAALTDALRAQQHEFSNRMHTLAGLIELGDHEAAGRYALDVSRSSDGLAEGIRERIEPPEIAALLLAKITIAAERDVTMTLTEDSQLPADGLDTGSVLTIAGNLIDNAIDAAADGSPPAQVTVHLSGGEEVRIEVSDSGPGVAPHLVSQIFSDGFTTKPTTPERPRGIGLALVHRLVRQCGGTIEVEFTGRTVFTVRLPLVAAVPPHVSA
jgi:two-component system CitB family sensor kinase